MEVYIRELQKEDALISYKWRNNPKVWKYTGSRPDREITPEIETEWLTTVLARKHEKRFAICTCEQHIYIGNVQLTHIDTNKKNAVFHIFIGDPNYWGKGIATQATGLILTYAAEQLALESVFLSVSVANKAAIQVYEKHGFQTVKVNGNEVDMVKEMGNK